MRLFLGPFLRAIFLVDFLVVLPCALAFPEAPSALEKASGVAKLRLQEGLACKKVWVLDCDVRSQFWNAQNQPKTGPPLFWKKGAEKQPK